MIKVERGLRMSIGLELIVAIPRKRATFLSVLRLDFNPNLSFSLSRHFYHGLPDFRCIYPCTPVCAVQEAFCQYLFLTDYGAGVDFSLFSGDFFFVSEVSDEDSFLLPSLVDAGFPVFFL